MKEMSQKVIAIDFDGVICPTSDAHNGNGTYPIVTGEPRPYVKEVMNYLYSMDVTVIIWTSREEKDRDYMVNWLHEHGIKYCGINENAFPWSYDARKIFAHMYVDDRGYGWNDTPSVMLDVLRKFMINVCDMSPETVENEIDQIIFRRCLHDNIH